MDLKGWALQYGDNAGTNYTFADTISNLNEWVMPDDLTGIYRLIHQANMLGIDAVEEATEEDEGPFYILMSRSYYGPFAVTRYIPDETNYIEPLEFVTIKEAQEWIDKEESGVYHTSHNEPERPECKIVST